MKVIELGQSAKVISGYAFKSMTFQDDGMPVIKISNIGFGDVRFNSTNTQFVDKEWQGKLDKKYHVTNGDILISLTGSHITQPSSVVGRVALYKKSFNSLLNQRAGKVINIDKEILNPKYLFYLLSSSSVRTNMALMASGAASQANISPKDVESLKLLVPSLKNQKKIAAILSTYDDLIDVNKERIKLLEDTATELYKEWFVRFRFPDWQSTKFEKGIPNGWKEISLIELGKITTGKTPSMQVSEFYNGEYAFYKTPDMHNKVFVFDTEESLTENGLNSQKSQIIEEDSIMVTCIGTGGITAISTKRGCTNQQINSIALYNKDLLYWAFFTIKNLKPQIELFGATGTTMTNLSKGKLSKLLIIKPNLKIIERYQNVVKPMFEQIKGLNLSNANLIEQKKDLLPRLMSGKLSLTELDIHYPPSMQTSEEAEEK